MSKVLIPRVALMVLFLQVALATAQPLTVDTIVRQSLRAHLGTGSLPADLTIQGYVTDHIGRRSLQIRTKGRDKIRYEIGSGTQAVVSVFRGRSAWTGPLGRLKRLPDHAGIHRAAQIPFLDVITEVGSGRFRARDRGRARIGAADLRHISIRVDDPTSHGRFLNRPLHEEVDLFLDPATHLIVRSQRMLAADNGMDFRVPSVLDFADYRVVGSLAVPHRIVNTIGTASSGQYRSTWVIERVLIDLGIDDLLFQPN